MKKLDNRVVLLLIFISTSLALISLIVPEFRNIAMFLCYIYAVVYIRYCIKNLPNMYGTAIVAVFHIAITINMRIEYIHMFNALCGLLLAICAGIFNLASNGEVQDIKDKNKMYVLSTLTSFGILIANIVTNNKFGILSLLYIVCVSKHYRNLLQWGPAKVKAWRTRRITNK